jgi:DNA-binding IclR family transcriptional regulator
MTTTAEFATKGAKMASEAVEDIGVGRRARGLDRAFEILDYLRGLRRPARPNEIAVGIKAPKSTTYELVNLMLKAGILEYADKEGRVFLGRKLYFLGLAHQSQFDLTRECRSYLDELAETTRETSQLCMLDGNKYTVAMMRVGARPFRISSDVGERIPVPWTASGRLLVSHMSDEEILSFIPREDFVLPSGARLDPKAFLAEVHKAREDGFFSFDSLADNFTHCFAAPVYQNDGICAATLCLIAPREDAARNHARYRDVLSAAARSLSEKAGSSLSSILRTGVA